MKRIIMMLTLSIIFITAIAFSAAPSFAAPCGNPASNNPHCITENPGGQQHGCQNNQTCTREFQNPGRG